jgi:hypothetical protein
MQQQRSPLMASPLQRSYGAVVEHAFLGSQFLNSEAPAPTVWQCVNKFPDLSLRDHRKTYSSCLSDLRANYKAPVSVQPRRIIVCPLVRPTTETQRDKWTARHYFGKK